MISNKCEIEILFLFIRKNWCRKIFKNQAFAKISVAKTFMFLSLFAKISVAKNDVEIINVFRVGTIPLVLTSCPDLKLKGNEKLMITFHE